MAIESTTMPAAALTSPEVIKLLQAIAASNPPAWQRPLREYPAFNWAKIGATVNRSDRHGATLIYWAGHYYLRRAGSNAKFGAAIWFSRPGGKGGEEESSYLRLITFKDYVGEAEPLPEYICQRLGKP